MIPTINCIKPSEYLMFCVVQTINAFVPDIICHFESEDGKLLLTCDWHPEGVGQERKLNDVKSTYEHIVWNRRNPKTNVTWETEMMTIRETIEDILNECVPFVKGKCVKRNRAYGLNRFATYEIVIQYA